MSGTITSMFTVTSLALRAPTVTLFLWVKNAIGYNEDPTNQISNGIHPCKQVYVPGRRMTSPIDKTTVEHPQEQTDNITSGSTSVPGACSVYPNSRYLH